MITSLFVATCCVEQGQYGHVWCTWRVTRAELKRVRVQRKRWLGRHTRWSEEGRLRAFLHDFETLNGLEHLP